MEKIKVFVSYDYKYDEDLKDLLLKESEKEASVFEIVDSTINTNLDTDYKLIVGKRMRDCDLVIFLCGVNTSHCLCQAAEMSIAREEGKDYVLINGRDKEVGKPMNSRPYDIVYSLDALDKLLAGER